MASYCVKNNDGYVEVIFEGEITLEESFDFKEDIKNRINDLQIYQVMVNLEAVSFMDSSGLGMLISLYKEVNENQGKIVFFNVQEYIMKLLKLVNLDKIFLLADTREEALSLLAQGA